MTTTTTTKRKLKLKKFLIHVTMGCNIKCAHCCMSATPALLKYKFTEDELVKLVEAAYLNKAYVVFSGGEPMLYLGDMRKALVKLASYGLAYTIQTNGFWGCSLGEARRIVYYLKALRIYSLRVSYDEYHAKFIDYSYIHNILQACEEYEVKASIAWVGVQNRAEIYKVIGQDMKYFEFSEQGSRLPDASGRGRYLRECKKYTPMTLDRKSLEYWRERSLACPVFNDEQISFYPGGYASLCCADSPRNMFKASTSDNWFDLLMSDMLSDKGVKTLIDTGVGGLVRLAEFRGIEVKSAYVNECQACKELLPQLFPREVNLPKYLARLGG